MQNIKKAFSFVELIVVLAILALLAIIGVNMYNSVDDKTNNSKVITGAKTLNNAFTNYLQVEKELPIPAGNKNYFKVDSSYANHDDGDIFGVYGSVTEETLPKKYLDNLPLDPVSNHYYAYGKTMNNEYFEIASVLRNNGESRTKLEGTYPGENGPISLIREYNGPQFLQDKSSQHLPYNPDEHALTAKIIGNDFKINGISVSGEKLLRTGDTIELAATKYAQLYFADGSVSLLGDDSEKTKLTLSDLDFKDPKDNLLTKVRLYLSVGSIFTQATALNNESDFEIYTSDTTAAVRGTEFLVSTSSAGTEVIVLEGEVEVYGNPIIQGPTGDTKIIKSNVSLGNIEKGVKSKIKYGEKELDDNLQPAEIQEIKDEYDIPVLNSNIPEGKTVAEIEKENIQNSLYRNTLGKDWKLYAAAGYDRPGDLELKNADFKTIGQMTQSGIIRECNSREVNTGSGQCNLTKWPVGIFNANDGAGRTGYKEQNFVFNYLKDLLIKDANAFMGGKMDWKMGNGEIGCTVSASSLSSSTGTVSKGDAVKVGNNLVIIDASFIALENGTNGIYIDNDPKPYDTDYIKYSDLELGDNFTIEIKIRGADLLRSEHDTNYFLLKLSNGFKLQLNNGNLELYNPDNCATLSGSTINTFINSNNNKFYKVILSNEKLVIADDSGNTIEKKIDDTSCTMSNINSIILGADDNYPSSGYSRQWNGIIDYLKIYKKED